MNRKYLLTLFSFFLLAVGFLVGERVFTTAQAQTSALHTPFTARMRLIANPGTPQEEVRGERIVGIRSDGSEIFTETLKGRPFDDRVVRVTRPDGQVSVMVGPLQAKSSWFTDARAMRARQEMKKRRRENSCLSSAGQIVSGHDVFYGMPVFVIDTPAEKRNNISIRTTSWMVPALDCFSVKSRIEILDAHGNQISVSLRETVEFQPGEPSEALFTGLASATERKPSELHRDYLSLLGGPRCSDCDQAAAELDLYYAARQSR